MAYFGKLKQAPFDALCTVGQVTGWREFNKFSQSSVISTSFVDVWPNASILSYLTTAETMHLSSTDADDTAGGSGAQEVKVFGLNDLYQEIEEVVPMAGSGNSTTTQSFLRVYRMIVTKAGSTGSNEGTITATASSAGTVQAYIGVGINQTLQSQYTVPAGYYLVITEFEATVQKGDQALVHGVVRPLGETFQVKRSYNIYQTSAIFPYTPPLLVPPKADISVRAKKITGAGNVDVSANYDGYLVLASEVNV